MNATYSPRGRYGHEPDRYELERYMQSRGPREKGAKVKPAERYAYDLCHLAWLENKISGWHIYDTGWEIDGQSYTFDQVREMVGQAPRRARKPVVCPNCSHQIAA